MLPGGMSAHFLLLHRQVRQESRTWAIHDIIKRLSCHAADKCGLSYQVGFAKCASHTLNAFSSGMQVVCNYQACSTSYARSNPTHLKACILPCQSLVIPLQHIQTTYCLCMLPLQLSTLSHQRCMLSLKTSLCRLMVSNAFCMCLV